MRLPIQEFHSRIWRIARRGFSLLEVMIVLAVTTVLLATVGAVFTSSQNAYGEIVASASTGEMTQKVLDRLVWELRFARADSIVLAQPTDSPSITFEKLTGWNVSTATYSTTQTISLTSGKVLLNGVAIGDGIKTLTFNQSGGSVTIAVEVERSVTVNGSARLFTRRSEVKVTP